MSSPTFDDILNLTHRLQQDLQAATAKLVTIRSWLAAQSSEKKATWLCPSCGADRDGPKTLESHLVNVHGYDEPSAESKVASLLADEQTW
jgi:hypothetical protein